jgi:hypothetical protein
MFASLMVDKKTCEVALAWPAIDAATTETALIGDKISFSGKMKHCFKLITLFMIDCKALIQPSSAFH